MPRRAFLLGCNGKDLCHCIAYDQHGALQRCDVSLMRDAFLHLGFRPGDITIPEAGATKGELQDLLEDTAYNSKLEDTFVFYFSGHSVGEHGLQLLIDAPYEDARRRWAAGDVVNVLNNSPAGSVIMILDSCEAGQAAKELARAHEEFFLLTATNRMSRAKEIEALQAGVFTYCLQDALTREELRTTGDGGLLDPNGNLGANKLFLWLKDEVPQCGQSHGKSVPEPWLYAPHNRDVYFASNLEPYRDPDFVPPAPAGYPPELIRTAGECLDRLDPDADLIRKSYRY